MNTPEYDDWERLFRQRLADLEAQPPADALARILAIANPSPAPVASPASSARTLGMGGMVAVLLGIWLMQATQRQQHVLAEPVKISRETIPSTGHRPSDYASIAKRRENIVTPLTPGSAERRINREPVARTQPQHKANRKDVFSTGRTSAGYTSLAESKRERRENTVTPLTPGSAERRVSRGPVAPTQLHLETIREDVLPTGHRPFGYASIAKGKRERQMNYTSFTEDKRERQTNYSSLAEGRQELTLSTGMVNPETTKSIDPDFSTGLTINLLETQRSVLPHQKRVQMAGTTPEALPVAPAVARQQPARSWFVAITPLYTYQQIGPVHTDERYVEQIQTPGTFSGNRAGWQVQLGREQALSKQFSIQAGLTVTELRQSVQYRSRGASFDSAKVEVLDNQTIRLTPLYRHQTGQLTGIRRFIGISTVIIWRPLAASAGLNRVWQPYLTAGLSAGKYTGAGGELSGFWQASAGVERSVWPGWWLRVGPSVQYGWHALSDSPVLTTRPYTYGLTIGLRH